LQNSGYLTNCHFGGQEIVTDRENGIIVNTNDSFALSNAMNELLLNRTLSDRLVANSFRQVYDFEVSKVSKQYEDLFAEIWNRN
jgi:glycosyltransferase involved in cell wall biosynthesis